MLRRSRRSPAPLIGARNHRQTHTYSRETNEDLGLSNWLFYWGDFLCRAVYTPGHRVELANRAFRRRLGTVAIQCLSHDAGHALTTPIKMLKCEPVAQLDEQPRTCLAAD